MKNWFRRLWWRAFLNHAIEREFELGIRLAKMKLHKFRRK